MPVVYVCFLQLGLLLAVISAENCGRFEFPTVDKNEITASEHSTLTVPFRLNTTNCQSPGDFSISVTQSGKNVSRQDSASWTWWTNPREVAEKAEIFFNIVGKPEFQKIEDAIARSGKDAELRFPVRTHTTKVNSCVLKKVSENEADSHDQDRDCSRGRRERQHQQEQEMAPCMRNAQVPDAGQRQPEGVAGRVGVPRYDNVGQQPADYRRLTYPPPRGQAHDDLPPALPPPRLPRRSHNHTVCVRQKKTTTLCKTKVLGKMISCKERHVLFSLGVWAITWLSASADEKCARFEFPTLASSEVTAAEHARLTLPFRLDIDNCESVDEFSITITKKVPHRYISDYCKLRHRNGECDPASGSSTCSCPDESGNYNFVIEDVDGSDETSWTWMSNMGLAENKELNLIVTDREAVVTETSTVTKRTASPSTATEAVTTGKPQYERNEEQTVATGKENELRFKMQTRQSKEFLTCKLTKLPPDEDGLQYPEINSDDKTTKSPRGQEKTTGKTKAPTPDDPQPVSSGVDVQLMSGLTLGFNVCNVIIATIVVMIIGMLEEPVDNDKQRKSKKVRHASRSARVLNSSTPTDQQKQ
ncbi:hypothetical protein BaRGS_00027011 [Batillaria attramentaria]|uniref:Uncharacterized protein n=1 Tax=Batillaria attramentaria TaxID=370345 RepID=A0ABD0K474_9CAEN